MMGEILMNKKYTSEEHKYKESGRCPRCRGLLLDAASSYPEAIFKDKYICKACARIWAVMDGVYERFQ